MCQAHETSGYEIETANAGDQLESTGLENDISSKDPVGTCRGMIERELNAKERAIYKLAGQELHGLE